MWHDCDRPAQIIHHQVGQIPIPIPHYKSTPKSRHKHSRNSQILPKIQVIPKKKILPKSSVFHKIQLIPREIPLFLTRFNSSPVLHKIQLIPHKNSPTMSSRNLLEVNPASMPVDISKDMIQLRPEEGSFDPNLVVILAALLCALICALAINYIIRWSFHFTRLFSARQNAQIGESPDLAAPNQPSGLKRADVQTLPTMIYTKTTDRVELDCPICLSEFADGEKIRVLPECTHSFHRQCIDQWLLSHSSCPTCRRSLVDFVAEKNTVAAVLCSYQQGQECPRNGSIHIIIHRAREGAEAGDLAGPATEQSSSERVTDSVGAQRISDRIPGSDGL